MKTKKTVTDKVVAANWANAQNSTGPRNTRAVKHNARKHGLLSDSLQFQSDEERRSFENLLNDLEDEQKPSGPLEQALVEEAAISIWKLRITAGWDMRELVNRRKAARAVLKTVAESYEDEQLQFFNTADARGAAAQRGWDCQELIIRSGTSEVKQEDRSQSLFGTASSKSGQVHIEAKLTASLDTVMRYQAAIKRDLYRAVAALREMRDDREDV